MIFWGKRFGSDGMFLQEQKDHGIESHLGGLVPGKRRQRERRGARDERGKQSNFLKEVIWV